MGTSSSRKKYKKIKNPLYCGKFMGMFLGVVFFANIENINKLKKIQQKK